MVVASRNLVALLFILDVTSTVAMTKSERLSVAISRLHPCEKAIWR